MRTIVVGLGNVLMGDDGFGPLIVRLLESRYDLGPDVSVLDAGTPGMDLVSHLHGAEAVIVVDTVKSKGTPGEIRRYRRDEIMSQPCLPRINPHQPGLLETLLTLDLVEALPAEVLLVGVIPGYVDLALALTEPVAAAIEPAIEQVLDELRRLRHPVRELEVPAEPDLWWAGAA